MADNWPIRMIGACAADEPYSTQIGPFGEKIRAENYTTVGAPVLRGTNVNPNGRFHDDNFVFIDPDLAETEFGKFTCEADDVILCHKGTLGKIGIIPRKSRFKKYIMGNSMMKVRCDRSQLEPLYLYYWLCSKDGQNYLFSRVSQVGVPQIQRPLTTLREAALPVPPLPEQKAIVAVLGALDDKIDLNRRTNETLEAMARALFKSWFVDFDPVRAKLDGNAPENLDPAMAALFPSRFEHEGGDLIPKGWERKRWGDIATLEYGKSLRNYRESAGKYRVFGTNGPIGYHDHALCETEGIVIGRKGAYRGIHYSPEPFFLIDTAFYLKPKESMDLKWAYYELLRFDINGMDSGSAIPSTSRDDFYGIPVVLPPVRIQQAFGKMVGHWFAKVYANQSESGTIATLRDTLLPKLLSGELSVAGVEKEFPL
jgi:type I restriction enzyme S subunit